jgi:hypothetical protein
VLRVLPAVLEFLEIRLGDLGERPPAGLRDLGCGPARMFRVEGILAAQDEQARFPGQLPRVREGYSKQRAQPHLAFTTILAPRPADFGLGRGVAKQPALVDLPVLAGAHLQPKPTAVAQQSRPAAGLRLRIFHLVEGKPSDRSHFGTHVETNVSTFNAVPQYARFCSIKIRDIQTRPALMQCSATIRKY